MVSLSPAGARTIQSLRPFVPAREFDLGARFYADLGFTITTSAPNGLGV